MQSKFFKLWCTAQTCSHVSSTTKDLGTCQKLLHFSGKQSNSFPSVQTVMMTSLCKNILCIYKFKVSSQKHFPLLHHCIAQHSEFQRNTLLSTQHHFCPTARCHGAPKHLFHTFPLVLLHFKSITASQKGSLMAESAYSNFLAPLSSVNIHLSLKGKIIFRSHHIHSGCGL